jgi:hypothetical protein
MGGTRLANSNGVTEQFLQRFKVGDLVDVKEVRRKDGWTGPHKLLVYQMAPPAKDTKPAAYIEVDLAEKGKLERWLIVGDQRVIRMHIPEEQKERVRVRRAG